MLISPPPLKGNCSLHSASSAGPIDCPLIVANEELGEVASRGSWGQTVASAWEGHLSGEGSRDLGVGELSCMNGFVNEGCSNSCARSTEGSALPWLGRVKGVSGALFGFIYTWRGEMEEVKHTLHRKE